MDRGRAVTGVVFDDETKRPIAEAFVHLGRRHGARTDPEGRFALAGLEAGRDELSVTRPGYRRRSLVVQVGTEGIVQVGLTPASADASDESEYEGAGIKFDSWTEAHGAEGYFVTELHPQGGARAAGVMKSDELLAVDGITAGSVPLSAFMNQVKGPEGTAVTLTLRREGRVFDVRAVRRRLPEW